MHIIMYVRTLVTMVSDIIFVHIHTYIYVLHCVLDSIKIIFIAVYMLTMLKLFKITAKKDQWKNAKDIMEEELCM